MAIENVKQSLSQGGMKERPGGMRERAERMPPPPPKAEPKDTSAFKGKEYMKDWERNEWFRKSKEAFEITGLPEHERVKLGQELLGGEFIKKYDPNTAIKKLELKRGEAKTQKELTDIERKIRVLKKFSGK